MALGEFSFEIPYLAYYLFQSLGLGYSFLYTAVFALVFGLFDYPTGGLADRFGRRRIYALGLVFVGIAGSIITFIVGYWWTIPTTGIIALAAFIFAMIFMPENWGAGEREPYTKLLKGGAGWILGRKMLLFLGLAETFFTEAPTHIGKH